MPTKPRISLWFEGLMVMFATEGADHCTLGVLRDVPKHTFMIEIWETDDFGGRRLRRRLSGTEIEAPLSLTVPDSGTVQFSKGAVFGRDNPNTEPDDFRWMLNFEDDLYHERVRVDSSGFRALMKINSGGKYFTSRLSLDEIAKTEKLISGGLGPPQRIGKVATAIGGHIYLLQQPRRAVFVCGSLVTDLLEFPRGLNYEIRVSQGSGLDPLATDNDAINYENVVPSSASIPVRRLRLLLHDSPQVDLGGGDPHAVCLNTCLPIDQEPAS